jgi:hypothetical protein
VIRRAAGGDEVIEDRDQIRGGAGARDPARERLASELVDEIGDLHHPAVSGRVELEVDRPHLVGSLGPADLLTVDRSPALVVPGLHLQTLLAPDAQHLLAVQLPAFANEQRMGSSVAVALMGSRDLVEPAAQPLIAPERHEAALGRAWLADDPARPSLGQPEAVLGHGGGPPSALRAQKFSRDDLPHDVELELLVRDELFEPAVLALELWEPACLVGGELAVGPAHGSRSARRRRAA